MIEAAIKNWESNKHKLEQKLIELGDDPNYEELVKLTIETIITDEEVWGQDVPDPERITQIDHGDYQGTFLFVIAEQGYQPSKYWYVYVSYGSCSGFDTLQAINMDEDKGQKIKDYMMLCLHIVQELKVME